VTRILVVDDNESGRYLLETLLRSDGYEVVSAASGAEALELARRQRPDLVISDILMPGMDGFTFCRTLKQDDELRAIPVVFYSASYDDERDRRLALAVGAERCITAPLEPSELLRVVRGLA
jgi:CheY-like chemotaxis protein